MRKPIGRDGAGFKVPLWLKLLVLLFACCCIAGCSVDPFGAKQEVRQVRTNTTEDINSFRNDLRRIEEEIANLSARFDRYSTTEEREVQALKSSVKEMETRIGESNTAVLSETNKRIADLDAKRVSDKNELVTKINSIVDRLNDLSRRARTPPPAKSAGAETATTTQKGFYYTVEDGDSLWGIARKYKDQGVTVEAIRQANNMGPSDNRIVTGQKLFIPVKE